MLPDLQIDAAEQRRAGPDRRRHKMLPALFSRHRRRRSVGRRKGDTIGYVDYYDWQTWRIALSILILSLLDAGMTGVEIFSGKVREANPLMNLAIEQGGMYTFYSVKAAMTALPLAILVLHKEWRLARITARFCLWSYVLVAFYHVYLVFIVPA